ncbi:MAG: GDSL-type esterase/lipase family protein [Lachnospiraceae bacterium]|nr:GDSL-type esterase/lipase family protein [Lachnospiraceae bacterium]
MIKRGRTRQTILNNLHKTPTLILLVISGMLLTVTGLAGRKTIYQEQDYDPVKTPIVLLVFQGMLEDKYPWQLFTDTRPSLVLIAEAAETANDDVDVISAEEEMPDPIVSGKAEMPTGLILTVETTGAMPAETTTGSMQTETVTGSIQIALTGEPNDGIKVPAEIIQEIKPLRSTTQEEANRYISVDIYGTAGVERAGEYQFTPVQEDYFDDALFIGDSRTVGLRDYSSLAEHADFLCETALTVYGLLEYEIGKEATLVEKLEAKDYGKIYLSVGINELGRGTTEGYTEKYREVIDTIRQMEPEAIIIIQAVLKVSEEKSNGDAIFNNSNIEARNRAIATLADNQTIFYVDINEAMCTSAGFLREDITHDGVHLLGSYQEETKQFLMAHGVV